MVSQEAIPIVPTYQVLLPALGTQAQGRLWSSMQLDMGQQVLLWCFQSSRDTERYITQFFKRVLNCRHLKHAVGIPGTPVVWCWYLTPIHNLSLSQIRWSSRREVDCITKALEVPSGFQPSLFLFSSNKCQQQSRLFFLYFPQNYSHYMWKFVKRKTFVPLEIQEATHMKWARWKHQAPPPISPLQGQEYQEFLEAPPPPQP